MSQPIRKIEESLLELIARLDGLMWNLAEVKMFYLQQFEWEGNKLDEKGAKGMIKRHN